MLTLFLGGGGIIFFLNKSSTTEQISNYQPTKNKNPKKQPVNNPPSPSPIPNNNFSSKTLANTIKEDLQDALTNESRQTKYFLDYQVFDNGDITIRTEENEKLNEELQENFHRHYQQRREKWDEGKREVMRKHGWSQEQYDRKFSWPGEEKWEVWKSDLEPQDHQEIVDLFHRIEKLTIEKAERPFQERMEKLNSNNKLFEGAMRVWDCPWKTGRYVDFLGKEKGKSYNLSIPENHPVLFLKPRDKKERFYWIEGAENIPIEKNPPGYLGSDDNNGNNYHKWVSLADKIVITLADF